jgi:hypothetical protein
MGSTIDNPRFALRSGLRREEKVFVSVYGPTEALP